jgi:hypothetical protein
LVVPFENFFAGTFSAGFFAGAFTVFFGEALAVFGCDMDFAAGFFAGAAFFTGVFFLAGLAAFFLVAILSGFF